METSSAKLQLPLLATAVRTARHGHGTCTEGSVPSGLRKWRTCAPRRAGNDEQPRVGVDYTKLKELCSRSADDVGDDARALSDRDERHQEFMSSYQQLLKRMPSDRGTTNSTTSHRKKHSHACTFPTDRDCHNVAGYVEAVHGCRTHTAGAVGTDSRLTGILTILRKLPLQRDASDVKQLSRHLAHFPSLLPDKPTPTVSLGVAARCLLEIIPKEGFSLPDRGGVYLILQGSVEGKTRDETNQKVTTFLLHRGEHFGAMEENHITRPTYPMYVTSSACALMRITVDDYHRVLQNCKAAEREERLALISACPALQGLTMSILTSLAHDIHWETVPANHILVEEGEVIKRVGFIQSGSCRASMEVPQTRPKAKVVISELSSGSCVGEGLLRGRDQQPYQVTTSTTRARIGWVSATTIRMNEVRKHVPDDRELTVPIPSKEMLRQKYARELMEQHWKKIKSDIVTEARSKAPAYREKTALPL